MARTRLPASLLAVLAIVLAGCAGPGDGRTIRIALDWTPNTNHTGLYVAQAEGWFADAGVDVEFLPYNSTSPDTLVSAGAAEFGISFQDSFTYSKAAGADATAVMAVLQHWASEIAVRADRTDITSPADLDGAVHGGFGGPGEVPKMRAVIRGAGGAGEFSTVVLGTSAYEALYAGQVDFTEPFVAWEGIEAELRGEPLRTFAYADYGFPDAYSVLLIGHSPWLAAHPEQARAFVRAAQRGYTLGADDPDRAARILLDQHPDVLTEPELVLRSQRMLAERFLRDDAGVVGRQTAEQWAGYSGFVFDSGTLAGPDGAPLRERPDFATWWTNDYLAPAP